MPGERIQRRIERLLDEIEAAADSEHWSEAARLADRVLRLDHENEEAKTSLEAATHDTGVVRPATAPPATSGAEKTVAPSTSAPVVSGRYEVRDHPGDGATKRVSLAHGTFLDRDIAFAIVPGEDSDTAGRGRVAGESIRRRFDRRSAGRRHVAACRTGRSIPAEGLRKSSAYLED